MTSGQGTDALDRVLARHFPGMTPHVTLMTSADPDGFEAIKGVRDAGNDFWFLGAAFRRRR